MTVKLNMSKAQFRTSIVKLAASQEGVVEGRGFGGRSNYTWFWADLYPAGQGQPWCGAFASWPFFKLTGIKLSFAYLNSYYTPAIVAYAKKHGCWKTRRPGQS